MELIKHLPPNIQGQIKTIRWQAYLQKVTTVKDMCVTVSSLRFIVKEACSEALFPERAVVSTAGKKPEFAYVRLCGILVVRSRPSQAALLAAEDIVTGDEASRRLDVVDDLCLDPRTDYVSIHTVQVQVAAETIQIDAKKFKECFEKIPELKSPSFGVDGTEDLEGMSTRTRRRKGRARRRGGEGDGGMAAATAASVAAAISS